MIRCEPSRVLLVRLSSIGDVIHALPAFVALQKSWPNTDFGWAIEPASAPLVCGLPGLRHTHVLDLQAWRRQPWRRRAFVNARHAVKALRSVEYELALDFQGLIKSALIGRLSGAPLLGFAAPDLREPLAGKLYQHHAPELPEPLHAVRRGLHLAAAATAMTAVERQTHDAASTADGPRSSSLEATAGLPEFPRLDGGEDHAYVDDRLRRWGIERFVVLNAANNWPSKRWEPLHYTVVAQRLYMQTGLSVLWIWGPGERMRTASLALHGGQGSRLCFPTSLTQLAALLRRALLYVGGDSAPLHLAVAVGTPIVSIFGPTDPARNGALATHDLAVTHNLPCSHCYRRSCPLGTVQCLSEIRPEAIVEAALRRLCRAASEMRAS